MNPPIISTIAVKSKDINGGKNGNGKRNSITTALKAPISAMNVISLTRIFVLVVFLLVAFHATLTGLSVIFILLKKGALTKIIVVALPVIKLAQNI